MDESEQPLDGGNLTTVVRIGNTVRRPVGPWTEAVHRLLRHLEARGFDKAPRVIGFDGRGREILSFIPGETAGSEQPWAPWVWADSTLVKVGRWLADYHETVRDFREPAAAKWRMCWAPQRSSEIVCHFDVAPYNIVRTPEHEIALIDWDVAAPGDPTLELAKAANSFAPVHDVATRTHLGFTPGELNRPMLERFVDRTRLLLDAYGLSNRKNFVRTMIVALEHSHHRIHKGAQEGDVALQRLVRLGIVNHLLETRALLEKHLDALARGIEQ